MDYRDTNCLILCLLIMFIFGAIKIVINLKNKNGNYRFNVKQSAVYWIMGILICFLILFNVFLGPKEYYALKMGSTVEQYVKITNLEDPQLYYKTTLIKRRWGFVLAGSIIVLIIGGWFIYALRDKNSSGDTILNY